MRGPMIVLIPRDDGVVLKLECIGLVFIEKCLAAEPHYTVTTIE